MQRSPAKRRLPAHQETFSLTPTAPCFRHSSTTPPLWPTFSSCAPPSDPPYVRPSSWVLLSVPSASAAGWCLLLWRQPIRGLTSSVSKIWLTGQPQRLRLLSEEEGEDGGGCLPSLSGCSFPSPWRWLGTASCFRPLKLWCGILSIWEPLCWFTARSAGTKDQTVTDINYLGQRRLREARKFQACWPLL